MLTGVHLVGHNKSMRLKWLDHVETMREREREREREISKYLLHGINIRVRKNG